VLSKAIDRWAGQPWWDALAGFAVALGCFAYNALADSPIVVLDSDSRTAIYTVLAGFAGAVLAFGFAPIAIVLALAPGPRLGALLKHHHQELRRALLGVVWSALALIAASIAALALDTGEQTASWVRYVVLAAGVSVLLTSAALIRTFGLLLLNIGKDQQSDHQPLKPVATRRVS
jgi:hypothetical protein